MADFTVSVTKHGVIPAVIFGGNEHTYGQTILFDFSSDWEGLTKEVIFFSMRGDVVVVWLADGVEINIPQEISAYGGDSKYTIRGFTIDSDNYISDALQVTGTLHYTYTAGNNTRLKGKLTPNTLDMFLATADQYIRNQLQAAKDSGEFQGDPGGFGNITADTETLDPQSNADVTVTADGPDAAKNFYFHFAIPRGESGVYVSSSDNDRPNGQNLWVRLGTPGANDVWIPDGITNRNGLVYLTCEGDVMGEGVAIVGKNFTILGHYASLDALQTAVPNPEVGDAYSVGSATPYNVYIYDGPTHEWVNYGAISSGGVVDTEMSDSSTNAVQNNVIKAYVDESIGDLPGYQQQHIALTLTLDSDDWSDSSQTVTASGVTSNNTVIVSPAPSGISAYTSCGVYCSAQSANSLTFVCTETPDSDITVNVVVLGVIE